MLALRARGGRHALVNAVIDPGGVVAFCHLRDFKNF